jgi:hypothetical protein
MMFATTNVFQNSLFFSIVIFLIFVLLGIASEQAAFLTERGRTLLFFPRKIFLYDMASGKSLSLSSLIRLRIVYLSNQSVCYWAKWDLYYHYKSPNSAPLPSFGLKAGFLRFQQLPHLDL